jgi:hypothetical protein
VPALTGWLVAAVDGMVCTVARMGDTVPFMAPVNIRAGHELTKTETESKNIEN